MGGFFGFGVLFFWLFFFQKSGPVDYPGSLKGKQFLMSLRVNAKLLGLGCSIGFICQGL